MARGGGRTGARKAPKESVPTVRACVGIGVSARAIGGLERLVATLPTDSGAAYIVALRHDDGVAVRELIPRLAKSTSMPVAVAEDGVALRPDHIWIGGAADVVTVEAGVLRADQPDGLAAQHGTVDSLLISVAEAYNDSAVIVVLAGLGSHGTTGVAATKRCGGLSIAEVNGEPLEPAAEAVTAAGIADLRVPVERMPREITAYVANLAETEQVDGRGPKVEDEIAEAITRIATILRHATGNDFHGYKHATFLRRIQRRMQVVQLERIDKYIARLRADPAEVQHLFQDLLIGVTQFFRDPQEFEVLKREVVPKLFEGKGADDRIRVWVMGCATGEEAYSIGILLREHMADMDAPPAVQIFATDIDARALAIARSGRYADSIAKEVSPERLARWFVKEGATYCVGKELREMCIFSPHNIIKDAPFSRIDLLSCRNLLIYLNGDLQDRVIPIFHFSLRPGGFLFLGPAENVTRHQRLFAPLDRKNRIFQRLDTAERVLPDFPLAPRSDRPSVSPGSAPRPTLPQPMSPRVGRRVEQVAERYAPAYVVVDANYDILHFSGRTGKFLEPATGAASLNLLNLVHRDLRLDLRAALHKAAAERQPITSPNIRQGMNGDARLVSLTVEPIEPSAGEAAMMVVLFHEGGPTPNGAAREPDESTDEHVHRLEAELSVAKDRLQTTVEELESTNEELKSSNEEYQSINEELQSANEELETSKEELQAVNEELQTVNGELAHRVGELARTNSDLKNLLESTQIATVFLDNDLRLRNFTPAASDIFHVIESDLGRPIAHLSSRIAYAELLDDARKVLKHLGQVEREVMAREDDRRYLVRVLPYRSVDNFIAGVVVTFLDITGAARAEAALRASERRFGEAQRLAGVGLWEWNLDTDETWWSPVVYKLWGLPPADAPPPPAERRVHAEDREAYDGAFEGVRRTGELKAEWRVLLPDGSVRWLAATGHMDPSEGSRIMLGVTLDVTERKQTERRLTLLLGELQHRVRNILGVVRSIVGRTVKSAGSVEELAAHLDGRLDTLARTQGVLARSDSGLVDLEEIIRDEMTAVAAREEQIAVEGPSVRLRQEAAETFALALHELTTNALKYGALSEPAGRLAVTWRVIHTGHGERLSLEWRESGVRALDVRPARNGFGRELIERGLPYELGANTSLEFARGGVRALIEVPLTDRIADLSPEAEPQEGV
jgi:two-component system, chemotaxis family, CheB/CheR fusion protein